MLPHTQETWPVEVECLARAPDIAAMIGSRICHDLISPVGAISNGVELLSMSGTVGGPELSLISDAVANANARIRFFRIAFGHATAGQTVSRGEVVSILDDLYSGARLRPSWMVSEDCDRSEVRMAFLAVLCLESAMPFGGEVRLSRAEGSWMMVGEGPKTKQDPALWNPLDTKEVPEVTANTVHFALLPAAVEQAGRSLKVERIATRIVMTY